MASVARCTLPHPSPWRTAIGLMLAGLVAVMVPVSCADDSLSAAECLPALEGFADCHATPPGYAHDFDLAAGEALVFVLAQRGVDLELVVVGPRGETLLAVDSPNGAFGPEHAVVVAGVAGRYRVSVASAEAASYGFRIERRPADPALRLRARAAHTLAHRAEGGGGPEEELGRVEAAVADLVAAGAAAEEAVARLRAGGLAHAAREEGLGDSEALRRRATGHYQAALDRYVALGEAQEVARALYWLARLEEGDREASARHLERARAVSPGDDLALEGLIANRLGIVRSNLGDRRGAIESYSRAAELFSATGDSDSQAAALMNAALEHLLLDLPDQAAPLLATAESLPIEESGTRVTLARRRGDLARARAVLASRRGDAAAAARYLRDAIEELESAVRVAGASVFDRAANLNALGVALLDQGGRRSLAQAGTAFAEARQLFDAGEREIDVAFIDLQRGRLAVKQHAPQRAREIYGGALDRFLAAGLLFGQVEAHRGLARATRQAGNHAAAQGAFETATACAEAMRIGAADEESRAAILHRHSDVYTEFTDVLLDDWRSTGDAVRLARALEVDDLRRARGLLDRLGPAANPSDVAARRARCERRPLQAAREAAGRRGDEVLAATLVARLEDLEPGVGASAPMPTATVDTVRARIGAGTALAVYSLREGKATLFWLDARRFDAHDLGSAPPLEEAARLVPLALVDPLAASAADQHLELLAARLLAPVADRLDGQRLIIVADGDLRRLPFGLLPVPGAPAGTALVDRHEVIYAPSVGTVVHAGRGTQATDDTIFIMADPVFGPDDVRLGDVATAGASAAGAPVAATPAGPGDAWARLPESAREAEAIAGRFPSAQVYLGFDATADRLRSGAAASYGIIHLAVHGELDPPAPTLPHLVFSRYDRQGAPRADSALAIDEIFALELSAELVVLSACRSSETPAGAVGLTSLAHAFFHAGARRLIGSLWRVDDVATARLMDLFYSGMVGSRLAPAAALTRAQRTLRRAGRPPAEWAGFIFEGEWRALDVAAASVAARGLAARDLAGSGPRPPYRSSARLSAD